MSRRALKELLQGRTPVKRFCTVTALLPRERYEVRDTAGRTSTVEATARYQVGDQVTVIDGRIVGPARRFGRRKIYRV
jgi:hypothetical protein